jgi:hypothetical protein
VADQALGWTVGYPISTVPPFIAVVLAAVIVVWDTLQLQAEGSDQWLFCVPVILGPPLSSAVLSPGLFYPRYFLVSLLVLLLMLARSLAAGLVVLMLAGNLSHTVRFWRVGRGGASRALSYLVANSGQPEIRVSSEPIDLWATLPIRFYERKLNLGSRIHYVSHARMTGANTPDEQLDWIIIQTLDARSGRAATLRLAAGEAFTLQSEYPNYGPTGMNWFLYRRASGQARGIHPRPEDGIMMPVQAHGGSGESVPVGAARPSHLRSWNGAAGSPVNGSSIDGLCGMNNSAPFYLITISSSSPSPNSPGM